MSKHKDTKMNNDLSGAMAFVNNANKNNSKSNIKNNKPQKEQRQATKLKTNNKTIHKSKFNAKKSSKSSNNDYPWTSLLGVNETAVLFAIQHVFSCKSRTEALAKLIKHNNLKIVGQKKNDFNTLKRLFITENMPKAKKRYKKYFGKK